MFLISTLYVPEGVHHESLMAYLRVYPARARGSAVILEHLTPELQARLDAVLEGTESNLPVSMEDLKHHLDDLEKMVERVVKATVESTLGAVGTVGALAVEEFMQKLKTALNDVSPASVVAGGSATIDNASGDGVSMECPETPIRGSVTSARGVQSSPVPSAFGVAGSSVSARVPAGAAAGKPGKNLIRS